MVKRLLVYRHGLLGEPEIGLCGEVRVHENVPHFDGSVPDHARPDDMRSRRNQQDHEPIKQIVLNEQIDEVLKALDQLPEEQREVVALRIYADQRFPAIAMHQGVSVNTAEGRFRYAMTKLRSLLKEKGN